MEAQINQTSLQNAAQREKLGLFNHFYEKLTFFLIRGVFWQRYKSQRYELWRVAFFQREIRHCGCAFIQEDRLNMNVLPLSMYSLYLCR